MVAIGSAILFARASCGRWFWRGPGCVTTTRYELAEVVYGGQLLQQTICDALIRCRREHWLEPASLRGHATLSSTIQLLIWL